MSNVEGYPVFWKTLQLPSEEVNCTVQFVPESLGLTLNSSRENLKTRISVLCVFTCCLRAIQLWPRCS